MADVNSTHSSLLRPPSCARVCTTPRKASPMDLGTCFCVAPGESYLIGGRWLLVRVGAVPVAGPVRLRLVQQRNVIRGGRFQTVSHLTPLRVGRLPLGLGVTFQGKPRRCAQWDAADGVPLPHCGRAARFNHNNHRRRHHNNNNNNNTSLT